jgi:mono/diheme cytochrome c family protein
MLSQGDADKDGKLTRQELKDLADRWYASLDTNQAEVVRQEEFLLRFGEVVSSPEDLDSRRGGRGGRSGANAYLGLFVVLDADKDASIGRAEFGETFARWFDTWDSKKQGRLERDNLVSGLSAAIPRTNMGTDSRRTPQKRPAGLPEPPPSPVRPAKDAIAQIHVADGFRIELAAAEPMIQDPAAISFDEDGRLYVLEMRNYMLDIDGTDERAAIGRISRLEDKDGDGRFDQSTVFVDGLVIPRSLAAVHGGVLYVANYQLYFARDTDGDGRADKRELVDADYGRGNVEHAPNGLMTAMDNWIYNARSQWRYRWFGDVLVKQPTENRGQWGITQDNYGRLFYNVNNSQLLGDYAPPNTMSRNPHHPTSAGLNLFVATDQRVFPIRMTTAINRGYAPDVLDASGKAIVFASSCSPLIYRGDNFPQQFLGNAFVCDSALNLIKRNLVFDEHLTLSSRFAHKDSEFLAATDERFRPVFLANGPDGALWIVDMYRGINQHGMFMTDYLRNETRERGLDKGVHLGRIYRVLSNHQDPSPFPRLSDKDSSALVGYLSHPNGWVRDTAQRLLVERADVSIVPELIELVAKGADELGRIHGLWTLEGLCVELPENPPAEQAQADHKAKGMVRLLKIDPGFEFAAPDLTEEVVEACLDSIEAKHPQVQIAAIRVAESLTRANPGGQLLFRQQLAKLVPDASPEVLFQIALTTGNLAKPESIPLLVEVAARNTDQLLIREAIVSGLYRWEIPFLKAVLNDARFADESPGLANLLRILATAVMRQRHPINIDELLTMTAGQISGAMGAKGAMGATSWRGRSLLAGMTSRTGGRALRPIRLRAKPESLVQISRLNDPAAQQHAKTLTSLLAWPGHQYDEVQAPPPGRPLTNAERGLVDQGRTVFQKICAGCHGANGEGVRPLGAPLVDSDWVLGSEDRLIRVLLHGLTGAVEVDGVTYQPPIVLPEMPAVAALDDAQIAAVLSYIRREWGHAEEPVSADRVAKIRLETKDRAGPWTAKELAVFQK